MRDAAVWLWLVLVREGSDWIDFNLVEEFMVFREIKFGEKIEIFYISLYCLSVGYTVTLYPPNLNFMIKLVSQRKR